VLRLAFGFVTGHGFSRADDTEERSGALAPAMSRPSRNSSPDDILSTTRVFFTTTKTSMGRNLLQSDRNAQLLVDVLRSLIAEGNFEVHDFVIMPNHVHLLMTLKNGMTIEKAMQLVKGRFSYRLSHEFGHQGDIWQKGFSEGQVLNPIDFEKCRQYIALNPVKAGLASSAGDFPYCFRFLARKKQVSHDHPHAEQGLKPISITEPNRHD
jgi:putative transposase